MSEDIEREIEATMRRIRTARECRDRVNANRARVQADSRRIRVVIGALILAWILVVLLFWRFG
jgi:hypothetical protein